MLVVKSLRELVFNLKMKLDTHCENIAGRIVQLNTGDEQRMCEAL
jgi:hypothetical protein